ncbi:MAG: DUF2185 domain-containing protein [Bradymonadales bacterium]|jgi:hypothetical protein
MAASAQIERIREKIESFKKEVDEYYESLEPVNNQAHIRENLGLYVQLVGALSSFRRLPGVTEHMGFEGEYVCATPEGRAELRKHLEESYGLTSEDLVYDVLRLLFHTDMEYADFLSFRTEAPNFDIEAISEEERAGFEASREFVDGFIESVGEGGFIAWDVGERIGVLRAARACELISSEFYWLALHQESRLATQSFESWSDFIVSALWGSVYYLFSTTGRKEGPELEEFLDLNLSLARRLVFEDQIWLPSTWIRTKFKQLALDPDSMFNYLENWKGPDICLASDKILVDGYGVGFMLHQEPQHEDDSGWRFFMGGEDTVLTEENEDEFAFVPLNWICNYDPEIVPFLGHNDEVAFVRDNRGVWRYLSDVDEEGNWLGYAKNVAEYATPLSESDFVAEQEEDDDYAYGDASAIDDELEASIKELSESAEEVVDDVSDEAADDVEDGAELSQVEQDAKPRRSVEVEEPKG